MVWNDWDTLKEDGPWILGISVCTKISVANSVELDGRPSATLRELKTGGLSFVS